MHKMHINLKCCTGTKYIENSIRRRALGNHMLKYKVSNSIGAFSAVKTLQQAVPMIIIYKHHIEK